mmetsp:Transcript_35401/g.54976  ORF Transcript_35401/g.54976 Transcript_35401/m.54976 type:complete len:291 (-) Transcript_35401:141-1013(-)
MAQMFTLVSLITIIASEALAPCGTVAPAAPAAPVGYTTTPAGVTCDTPLCQGLVGAGVGVAGLAAIGGIAGALAHKKHAPAALPPTAAAPTAAPVMFNRVEAETTTAAPSSSGGWLLPLLLGLLLLCCLLGIIGYMCMKPKQKRATKVKKTAPVAAAKDIEATPLLSPVTGHWEQPRQIVPVTTAQTSLVPQVTTAQMVAPTYAVPAPTYVETAVAPTYAMPAPAYYEAAVAPTFAMAAPTIVEAVAPASAYAMPTAVVGGGGYATAVAPTGVLGTIGGAYPTGAPGVIY